MGKLKSGIQFSHALTSQYRGGRCMGLSTQGAQKTEMLSGLRLGSVLIFDPSLVRNAFPYILSSLTSVFPRSIARLQ